MAAAVETYWHTKYKEYSIDIHGLEGHTHRGVVDTGAGRRSVYKPVTVEFRNSRLDTDQYERCSDCGRDHSAEVDQFLDRYRFTMDGQHILKMSEEKAKRWSSEGLDTDIAHRLTAAGVTREQLEAFLAQVEASKPPAEPPVPPAPVAVQESNRREQRVPATGGKPTMAELEQVALAGLTKKQKEEVM